MISLRKLAAVVLAALPALQEDAFAAALPADPAVGADIYGGQTTTPNTYKYVVALNFNDARQCVGVLLNAYTVITAAHCELAANPSRYTVRAGSWAWNSDGVVAGVHRYIPHPDYNYRLQEYSGDIAVWQLTAAIEESSSISYVTLPAANPDEPAAGTMATILGWGATNGTAGQYPRYLQEATVPVAPSKSCQDLYGQANVTVDSTMICVGADDDKDNEPGPCDGDDGGPLIDPSCGALWGIEALSPGECGNAGDLYIYTRVTKYVDWINANKFSETG